MSATATGSREDLVELLRSGSLGSFLAKEFRGSREVMHPSNEDRDAFIGLRSNRAGPKKKEISEAVRAYFKRRRYAISSDISQLPNCFEMRVFLEDRAVLTVHILMRYPQSSQGNFLRLTTLFTERPSS